MGEPLAGNSRALHMALIGTLFVALASGDVRIRMGILRGVADLLINLLVVIALWHQWQSRNRLEPAISH